MTRKEIINRLCLLQQEVSEHLDDYANTASDCFCGEGGFWGTLGYSDEIGFHNDGVSLEFIEAAVREKIAKRKPLKSGDPSYTRRKHETLPPR